MSESEMPRQGIEISPEQDLDFIDLRGEPSDKKFIAAVKSVLGQALPVNANMMSEGSYRIYWLGPNEWLVTGLGAKELISSLREAFSGLHASVTDVSGGNVSMQLAGNSVRDVLAKGCTLDFHPEVFKGGSCAQSGMAKANVLIGLEANEATFHIVVRRSFAEYLALWLTHSAAEYESTVNAA
jgi:sarcosine oxidase, subunit gamma